MSVTEEEGSVRSRESVDNLLTMREAESAGRDTKETNSVRTDKE